MFLCVLYSKKANKHVQMEIKGYIDGIFFWFCLFLQVLAKKKKKFIQLSKAQHLHNAR